MDQRSASTPKVLRPTVGGSAHFTGVVSDLWWFYYTGESTHAVWTAYVEHCRRMLDSRTPHPSLVWIARRAEPPSAEHRDLIIDAIRQESTRLSALCGSVIVVDSPLHILALKSINWLVAKPFPETVCGSAEAAALWLQKRGARVDPESLVASLRRVIPEAYLPRD